MTDTLGDLFGAPKQRSARAPDEKATPEKPLGATQSAESFLLDDAYGMTAITRMADQMRTCAEGGRDNLLNTLCMKAGVLVRDGHLTQETAENYLRAAALEVSDDSFDEWQIDEKIERVIEEGIESDYEPEPQDDFAGEGDEGEGPQAAAEDPPESTKPTLHELMVSKEVAVLRARKEAQKKVAAEEASASFRIPVWRATLREELLIPAKPTQYRIDRLLPMGGNVLMPAGFKAGKTSTINNAVASLADAEPFLGKFDVTKLSGRVSVWNYEVGEDQYREWLRAVGVKNPENVTVLNLRGYRIPLTSPSVEDWVVEWHRKQETEVWIMDPFARAATGIDENSNTEVGVWLDTFDVIKERAGISEGILPTHTGRAEQEAGAERARGATRLDDWADVRWILTSDDAGVRYLRAHGRDVDVPEEKLTWDEDTRRITFGGWDRKGEARRRLEDEVVNYVRSNPGASSEDIEKRSGLSPQKGINAARMSALAGHRIRFETHATTQRKSHYAND